MVQTTERYRVRGEIGRGRCALVLEADDLWLGRRVALKCGIDAAHDDLLHAEARRLARIDSDYVVRLHDLVATPRPMLVLELLQGETLRARLGRAGRLGMPDVDSILTALLRGLEALHATGVVHGDLKPENVWLLPAGALKLLDVGAGDDATALYAAPEAVPGAPTSMLSDLYAAGVIVWEMLVGRPPFDATDAAELALRKRTQRSPTAASGGADIDADIEAWLARCLEADPSARFQTAAAARQAWQAARGARGERGAAPQRAAVELYPAAHTVVHEALDALRAGTIGGVVVVSGPPGCGKSTFLRSVVRDAAAMNATVLRVRRHDSVRRVPGADWSVTVRDADRHGVALPPWIQGEPDAAFQARVLAALERLPRCVVVVDDPARCDGATRRLVLALAEHAESSPRLVIAAVDSTPSGRVAATTRDALCGAARHTAILDSIDEKAWREFVALRLGATGASDALLAFLRARTAGNPRLAVEVLADLRARGALRPADDSWVFRPERAAESLPPMSARWLGRALTSLAPARRDLLRTAAVGGLCFRADAVARVVDRPEVEVIQELHALAAERQVIARDANKTWSFQPALLCELLRDELAPETRRALHVRFAAALSELAPDDTTIGRHWYEAGELARAVPALERAAGQALAAGDAESAAAQLELACRVADGGLDSEAAVAKRAELGLARARALRALAGWDAALDELAATTTLARAWGLDRVEMQALRSEGEVEYARGQFDAAIARYLEAQECAARLEDTHEIHELALQIGNIHFERGDLDAALGEYRRTLDYAAARDDADLEARAANNVGMIESIQGRKEQAVEFFNRSLTRFVALGRDAAVARLNQNIGQIYLELGNWAEARNFFQRSIEASERTGEHALLAVSCLDFAESTLRLGAVAEAAPAISRALAICRERGDETGIALAMRLQAQVAAAGGDVSSAEALLIEAIDKLEPLGQVLHLGQCWKELGAIRLRAGRREAALQALAEARRRFESLDAAQHTNEVDALRRQCVEGFTCP